MARKFKGRVFKGREYKGRLTSKKSKKFDPKQWSLECYGFKRATTTAMKTKNTKPTSMKSTVMKAKAKVKAKAKASTKPMTATASTKPLTTIPMKGKEKPRKRVPRYVARAARWEGDVVCDWYGHVKRQIMDVD